MKKILCKLITLCGVVALVTLTAVACSNNAPSTQQTSQGSDTTSAPSAQTTPALVTTTAPINDPSLNISEYTIIRSENASSVVVSALKSFKNYISDYTEESLTIKTDFVKRGETLDNSHSEILIGQTTRPESSEAFETLSATTNDYYIGFVRNKLVIVGKTDEALLVAMREFILSYVATSKSKSTFNITEEFALMARDDDKAETLINLTNVETLYTSKIAPASKDHTLWPTYERILKLEHNGENNGILFATGQWAKQNFPVYKRTNDGVSWELIATVAEQLYPGYVANWQPHIYELPCQVGEMPEGTLLLAGCTRDPETKSFTAMTIFRSYDLGLTWEEFTVVDTGNGLSDGLYEPYLICDKDGTLVCFYSDETEVSDVGGQRLVFKASKDGVNWGEEKYCVAPKDRSLRPGMVTVAQMGDHGYILSYEMIGQAGGPVYTKVSDSLTDWGDGSDLGKKITSTTASFTGCTPYCAWTPAGGEYGTVIAAGRFGDSGVSTMSDLFLSFDLGKTWYSFENPLPYGYEKPTSANYAYSFGFFCDADGYIYYVNNVFPDEKYMLYTYSDMKMAKIKITTIDDELAEKNLSK